MQPVRILALAAGFHGALALAAIYHTARINNHSALSDISAKEILAMCGVVLLPPAYAWVGLRLARTNAARWLLAIGQTVALILFAATFGVVVQSVEPMAPLLFFLVTLYLAVGLVVLLLVVFLVGRAGR